VSLAFPPSQKSARGFTIFEAMLALGLFALAVVGITQMLNTAIQAASENQRETMIRQELQSRLAEERVTRLEPGTKELTGGENGLLFERVVEPLDLENKRKNKLAGLYHLTIKAKWKGPSQEEERTAEIYVYQP
jgi:type II secretory pathway component PulJ